MKAEIIPIVGRGREQNHGNAVYITHDTRSFRLYGDWYNFGALGIVQRFQHALAAHDAELDKTRFVELTGTNVRLSHEVGVLEARIRVLEAQIGGLKDEAAHSRFNLCRIMAAGPGNVDATVRILQKYRDIQNSFVETPMLREQLKEAQEKYANLRMEIKNLL